MTKLEKIKAIQTALGVAADGEFNDQTLDAVFSKLVPIQKAAPAAKPPAPAPAKPAPALPEPVVALGKIGPDHWLEGAVREVFEGGKPMPVRRCVVMHFTSGATALSSVNFWRSPEAKGANAHLVIARSGKVIQCRPFDRTCGHAGVSRWRDPKTGTLYTGCNDFSIGIEMANAGNEEKLAARMTKLPIVKARHRKGGPEQKWEAYTPEQLASVFKVVSLLMERYKLDDITGHDCIAPERKDDPGPAFPMEELRKANGLKGLPAMHQKV
ncbi:MAG TPA: N-acetylmuramoyl-L-alanine amidase [Chthoniobacteraceae bacterium]|jgi:N-acetyl-anhydromuramyl-L-alanine amidase AmpD|nr:N-acetylmuramoyl-L-alanine amidase [Chthoniobacteraceae bacterium]